VAAGVARPVRGVSGAGELDRALQPQLPAFGAAIQNAEPGGRNL